MMVLFSGRWHGTHDGQLSDCVAAAKIVDRSLGRPVTSGGMWWAGGLRRGDRNSDCSRTKWNLRPRHPPYQAVSTMYECPVCGYPGLRTKPYERWPPPEDVEIFPPYEEFLGRPSYEVCPRCGFEFGNDDNPGASPPVSSEQYRREWELEGSPWFQRSTSEPPSTG